MSTMGTQSAKIYDCIVVGGGVIGSSAAYNATKAGYKTLLLDQFPLPHTRGSSHGQTRILGFIYNDPLKTTMVGEALAMWKDMEQQVGKTLFHQVGYLVLKPESAKADLDANIALMKERRRPVTVMSNEELRKRYPMLKLPDGYTAALDEQGGVLKADRCLDALRTLIQKQGGTIQDETKVTEITPSNIVTVSTNKGVYRSRKLILCPGPWAKDIMQKVNLDLPLKTMRGMGVYWRVKGADDFSYTNNFPITIDEIKTDNGYRFFCVFPSLESPGLVKVVSRGEPPSKYVHPDDRDSDDGNEMLSYISEYIRTRIPGLEDTPSITEPAVYTVTKDRSPIVDRHPQYKNIVFAVGMSGSGFKAAPVTGKLLVEMAFGLPMSYDISEISLNRIKSNL